MLSGTGQSLFHAPERRTQAAFVRWIKREDGIEGARQLTE
jgi:hypothetical protein